MTDRKPFVLGLVGGVAAGKSHVARALEGLGAVVIDADRLGHQVLARPLVARRLGQVFGPRVIDPAGGISRQQIAALVFSDVPGAADARRQLEKIAHPLIHAAAVRQLRGYREAAEPPEIVVLDAPLLLEANWAPLCDAILMIETPLEARLQRALERDWTEAELHQREAAQKSLEEKRSQATHILPGDAEPRELERQLRRLLNQIREN